MGPLLLALGALAALVPGLTAASSEAPLGTSLERALPAKVAGAAATTTIFTIQGTAEANAITAWTDSTGRLVLGSPEGIVEPDGPAPECSQDSPTQVSCVPGYIGAIAGDLGGGADTFSASPNLSTLVGISLVTEQRSLSGGPGRDQISGGLGGDLLSGGGGPDAVFGFGGSDLIRGEAGRDDLRGGGASDVLLGGGGPDKLHGGAARDLCNGGGGNDTAKSCNIAKKVP